MNGKTSPQSQYSDGLPRSSESATHDQSTQSWPRPRTPERRLPSQADRHTRHGRREHADGPANRKDLRSRANAQRPSARNHASVTRGPWHARLPMCRNYDRDRDASNNPRCCATASRRSLRTGRARSQKPPGHPGQLIFAVQRYRVKMKFNMRIAADDHSAIIMRTMHSKAAVRAQTGAGRAVSRIR